MTTTFRPTASTLPAVTFTMRRDGTHVLADAVDYQDPVTGSHFVVWMGFEWDGCSIPRILWPITAPFELSIVSGLIHDFLYRHGGRLPEGNVYPYRTFTRLEADRIFERAMQLEGVPWTRRRAAYLAVRAFGRSAWQG